MLVYHFLKDELKHLFHKLKIIPYRKKTKRFRIWNFFREEKLLRRLNDIYSRSIDTYNDAKASIVMPAYNRSFCIGYAIQSVLLQTHSNWQLIIIDDGSTDDLTNAIRPYINDPRIELLRIEREGVAQARNIGLANAKGSYIFFLDTDNTWESTYLRTMIVFMEIGSLACAYSGVRLFDDDSNIIGYYGEEFKWLECLELNHIDINSFAHRMNFEDQKVRFDKDLKRLVDWDYILAITATNRTAFAPFIGVNYYDGTKGNRITYTELKGEEIRSTIEYIQTKHKSLTFGIDVAETYIRPHWRNIIRKGLSLISR